MEDVGLSRALATMRDHPERTFTIQGLAEVAGMSRSVFAARFSESLDRPPMEFLKEVRLGRAAEVLARTDLPVKAIASPGGLFEPQRVHACLPGQPPRRARRLSTRRTGCVAGWHPAVPLQARKGPGQG